MVDVEWYSSQFACCVGLPAATQRRRSHPTTELETQMPKPKGGTGTPPPPPPVPKPDISCEISAVGSYGVILNNSETQSQSVTFTWKVSNGGAVATGPFLVQRGFGVSGGK